ncbi:hypothetical protein [Streptomyces sp. NPDC050528]|uniref:hypothetical protein n=1 Tax=unclassified Streptomyces TaxID=2593676 RepID=UPI003789B91C
MTRQRYGPSAELVVGHGWAIVLVTSASGADDVTNGEPAPNSVRQARELAGGVTPVTVEFSARDPAR